MKKTLVITFCVLCTVIPPLFGQEAIQFPTRSAERGLPLMKTFEERRSGTEFGSEVLSLQDLGDLLWAAVGFNRPDKRTNATAVNAQEIDVYVCLAEGSYLYNAKEHRLDRAGTEDVRPGVGRGDNPQKPPVCLIIVADMSRSPLMARDADAANRMAAYDAGIVSQNIYMFCAGNGLSTRCRAGMDKETLAKGLDLSDNHVIHLNHPVGYQH